MKRILDKDKIVGSNPTRIIIFTEESLKENWPSGKVVSSKLIGLTDHTRSIRVFSDWTL